MQVAVAKEGQGGFDELDGANGITVTTIGNTPYALVASSDDDGVQIIDITDPADPRAVAGVTDGQDGFNELDRAYNITTITSGSSYYALVASFDDDGVQIIDITDPANPFNPLGPYLELDVGTNPAGRAEYDGLGDGNHALVFEYTVRDGDSTNDLDYTGTDALKLGHNTLEDASDSADLSGITLPAPGEPNSLSHNKDIRIGNPVDDTAFITTWETASASQTVRIPVEVYPGQTMTVD